MMSITSLTTVFDLSLVDGGLLDDETRRHDSTTVVVNLITTTVDIRTVQYSSDVGGIL